MKFSTSFVSGLAGATVLTLFHQLLRVSVKDAPRMDKLGNQALKKVIKATGGTLPSDQQLKTYTFAGDIISNAIFYAAVGTSAKKSTLLGAGLGLSAGIGGVLLPKKMGLNPLYSAGTNKTKLLTIGLYLTGGLVAGIVYKALDKR